jgi:hypothetical protein
MSTLTPAQSSTVLAWINSHFPGAPLGSDSAFTIAIALNVATAAFQVWKSIMTIAQVGATFDPVELATLTATQLQQLEVLALYNAQGMSPATTSVRTFYINLFSGKPITLAALASAAQRLATTIEQLLATGTGTNASPATMGYEGPISYQDVQIVRGG